MREILEKLRELPADVLDEAFGSLGVNIKSVEPLVRADHVYRLQAHSYLRGLMTGLFIGGALVGSLLLDRNLENVYQQNKQISAHIDRQRQQLAERESPVSATQDK